MKATGWEAGQQLPAVDGIESDYTIDFTVIPIAKPLEWLVKPLVGLVRASWLGREAGKGVMNPSKIHFMQSSIKNTTGNYTVLGNAEALANGSLNPNILRMNVWKDASGKVWTLDHRRLGAFRLSGLQEAPIQWANPSGQMWKMTTTNGGTSIKLKLGVDNDMTIK